MLAIQDEDNIMICIEIMRKVKNLTACEYKDLKPVPNNTL
jgi:hypothetical protein